MHLPVPTVAAAFRQTDPFETTPAATVRPAPRATAVPASSSATETAEAEDTAQPALEPTEAQASAYIIANTGGAGAYLRRTPRLEDHLRSWIDGTRMEVIGQEVEAEGQLWRHVRDPRGNEGYMPAEFLAPTD
jgi:hypothetical protein